MSVTHINSYQRTVLDNGVRVVTEAMPSVRSLAIGAWFDTGSRDEPEELSGISHFLEHMNFKGTERRSAVAIAREIEGRGGHLNAFTSKEMTSFLARVVDTQIQRAIDILSDMTQHSVYDPKEIDRERNVILEELKNIEDTPDDLVFEHFWGHLFEPHPLGRPVIGIRETLATIDQDKLKGYRSSHYAGSRVVIAASGNLSHKNLVRMVEHRFKQETALNGPRLVPQIPDKGFYRYDHYTTTQQAHVIWGCRALAYKDRQKYPLLVLNTLLGGGMSSRLFQNIREKRGLAYSVFSFTESYMDSGIFCVYAGTDPSNAEKALKLVEAEVRKMAKSPITAQELNRMKDQLKGNLLLGLESPNSRMYRLAKMEMYDEYKSLDDVIASIDAVTTEEIQEIADKLFNQQAVFATILWPNKS